MYILSVYRRGDQRNRDELVRSGKGSVTQVEDWVYCQMFRDEEG